MNALNREPKDQKDPNAKHKVVRCPKKPNRVKRKETIKSNLTAWLFLFPFMLLYAWFMLYPIIQGFFISLTSGSFGAPRVFSGVDNYMRLLRDNDFWQSLWNTIYFVLISTPTIVIFGLILALIVNAKLKGTTFLRSAFFMPYMLSISVMASIWVFILQPYTGFLNAILQQLGVSQEIFWLGNEHLAWISILVATLWWTLGFNMVLFLAGLQDISEEMYEAADIDGASSWAKFFHITLPSLKGVITLVVILQSVASFKLFGQPWLMTGGGPGDATRPLVQYIYELGFIQWDPGYASAVSYVLFGVMAIFAALQYKLLVKKEK
ncbi:carbohydrate ABC transporter permease [Halobacillus sp. Marseille-Q1614]|uniref:carbohydrate ABC transporter permease n=1 Tax=Halobacillus sp. Marseille-Q1614 TaxID=2709134 RepID=UPI00156F2E7F|nr:sugar ABC transporter permease [Halobacillus sp. Marseille-Q1614]